MVNTKNQYSTLFKEEAVKKHTIRTGTIKNCDSVRSNNRS